MKIIFMRLVTYVFFSTFVNGATIELVNLEAGQHPAETISLLRTPISAGLAQRAHSLFEADYERNVGDLIQTRWFFRKTANCTEATGNTLLYIGSGAASVAAGIKLVIGIILIIIALGGLLWRYFHPRYVPKDDNDDDD